MKKHTYFQKDVNKEERAARGAKRERVIFELKNEGRERERKRELEEVEQKKKNSEGRPSERRHNKRKTSGARRVFFLSFPSPSARAPRTNPTSSDGLLARSQDPPLRPAGGGGAARSAGVVGGGRTTEAAAARRGDAADAAVVDPGLSFFDERLAALLLPPSAAAAAADFPALPPAPLPEAL